MGDSISKVKDIKNFGINKLECELFNKSLNMCRHNHLWKHVIKRINIINAIKIISRNCGSNTAGVDGIDFRKLKNMDLEVVVAEVKKRLYGKKKAMGREVLIPKENGKFRPLGITNIFDRIAQQCVRNILEPIVEAHFNQESFGFRKGRNATECMSYIAQGLQHIDDGMVYDCDLKSYFDTVQIDKVLNKLKMNHKIFDKQFLKCIKSLMWIDIDNKKYEGTGLRQGTILGPILANVMLHDFELKLNEINDYKRNNGHELIRNPNIFKNFGKNYKRGKEFYFNWLRNRRVVRIVRYADDFVLISKGKYDIYDAIILLEDWCKENGLEINQDKTRLIKITSNKDFELEFLGYKLRKMNDKVRGKTFIISVKNQKKVWLETKKRLSWAIDKGNMEYFIQYIRGIFQYYDICTNLTWLISRIHLYLIKRMFRRRRKGNHIEYIASSINNYAHFIIHGVVLDLWDMRVHSTKSTKEYMIEVNKLWRPEKEVLYKEIAWLENFYENRIGSKVRNSTNLIYVPSLIRQYKRDKVFGKLLLEIDPKEIELHHKIPKSLGGKDEYSNLILLTRRVHKLVHKVDLKIEELLKTDNIKELNKLRKLCGNKVI